MIEGLFLAAIGVCCLIALRKWWYGVWLCIAIGFLQDPIRKLVPGEPVYMVLLCAIVFFAVVVGLVLRRYKFSISEVPGWQLGVSRALFFLLAVVVLQIILAFITYRSIFLAGIGFLSYVAPVLAILTGFYFACRIGEAGVVRFIAYYCMISIAFTSGIYLEYIGFEWGALGEVGDGLLIYDVGTVLKGYSGFFRSSELAAWHIMIAACLLLVLATRSRFNSIRVLCVFGVAFLVAAGLLTGRRKLIVSIVIFISCYWLLITIYYRHSIRVALVVILLGVTVFWLTAREYYSVDKTDVVYDLYLERASGVFGDISERGRVLGIGAVISAIKKHGFFGLGAGTAGQGARFVGVEFENIYEAEGGVGRIVTELGLLGLIALLWLAAVFLPYFRRLMEYISAKGGSFGYICYGMVGVLLANLAHFTVASQVFSDPMVLILLGLITGIVASGPVLVNHRQKRYTAA